MKETIKEIIQRRGQIVNDGEMLLISGKKIDLFDPDLNDIVIEDIARGLAQTCRWNGQTRGFYSVAQHSCVMYDKAPEHLKLSCLFHDGEEAYWGDVIKPIKNVIKKLAPEITQAMENFRNLIFTKFQIQEHHDEVKILDKEELYWEYENVKMNATADFWSPEKAEQEFLKRYEKSEKKEESKTEQKSS
jgi:5'-deoxynucleotidase YfbR-like HD superfamily hydrolase